MTPVKNSGGYHRNVPEKTVPNVVRPSIRLVADPAIPISSKALSAYDRLFGAHLPHQAMLRLNGFNSTALTLEFKNDVRTILSKSDLGEYYDSPDDVRRSQIFKAAEFDSEGKLLVGWRTVSRKSNPHHIVPHSRFGTSHPKNFRHVDRVTHNDFHTVFSNLTPVEQMLHMLAISAKELNPVFAGEFLRILSEADLAYYYRK